MDIKRESNFFALYDYHIIDGDKKLSIYIGPDRCLHFLLKNKQNEKSLEESFSIRKDISPLYALFLEAYENIVRRNIYEPTKEEVASCKTVEDSHLLEEVTKEQNALIKELCQNEYERM